MSTVDTPNELRSVSRSPSITPSEPSFESFELEAHLRDTPSPGLPFYTPHSNHEPCHTLAFDEFALFYHRQLAVSAPLYTPAVIKGLMSAARSTSLKRRLMLTVTPSMQAYQLEPTSPQRYTRAVAE